MDKLNRIFYIYHDYTKDQVATLVNYFETIDHKFMVNEIDEKIVSLQKRLDEIRDKQKKEDTNINPL